MMKFSITKNGKPLSEKFYNWDEKTKTLSTNESDLVLNFSKIGGVTFKTGSNCIFNTGLYCTFKTGSNCTFDTGPDCTFKTGSNCTFNTGQDCTFDTGSNCTFNTGPDCTFDTGLYCTFNTGRNCTFKTSSDCTFNTGLNCVVVRRDIFEVIILDKNENHIRLNQSGTKGYTSTKYHKITIDGKEIEISHESYKNLRDGLLK